MNTKIKMNLLLALLTAAISNAIPALADANLPQQPVVEECTTPAPQGNWAGISWVDDKFSNFYGMALLPTPSGLVSACPILFSSGVPINFSVNVNLDPKKYGDPGRYASPVLVNLPGKAPIQLNASWCGNVGGNAICTQFYVFNELAAALKPYKDAGQKVEGSITFQIETTKLLNNNTVTIPFILN